MEILYEQEFTNTDNQSLRLTVFRRDARSPLEIQNNEPVRYENCCKVEVYDEPTEEWIVAREEILEYLQFERTE